MKKFLTLLLLCITISIFGQAKVKFVNVPTSELDYPLLSLPEDIKTYTVRVHLHDLIPDLEWTEEKVLAQLNPLKNYTFVEDNADFTIHLDYYYQKEMMQGGEGISIPIKCTVIDGGANTFLSEFVKGNDVVAQATASATHEQIVAKIKAHLPDTAEASSNYIANLFDGKEFTVGSLSSFFTIKKGEKQDQIGFDKAIDDLNGIIYNKLVTKNLMKECQPSIDFWKAGLDKYSKSKNEAEYLACGANLFNISLKQNDPKAAQHYFDLIKDIKNAWTPKENILEQELSDSKQSEFKDIISFAKGGKSSDSGNSAALAKNGKVKMHDDSILEGSISFKKNADGDIDKVVVTQTLNDFQEIDISRIKGGTFDDVRFVKVETRGGDELYRILDSNGPWTVIRPIEDSGNGALAIGNSEKEKSYHLLEAIKINAVVAEKFSYCSTVVENANNKEYGRSMDKFTKLMNDLAACR